MWDRRSYHYFSKIILLSFLRRPDGIVWHDTVAYPNFGTRQSARFRGINALLVTLRRMAARRCVECWSSRTPRSLSLTSPSGTRSRSMVRSMIFGSTCIRVRFASIPSAVSQSFGHTLSPRLPLLEYSCRFTHRNACEILLISILM